MRIGDPAAGASLTGNASSMAEQVKRYATAGVHQLVIEPVASDLADFVDQITQFATKIAPLS
jgi:hypothetical protein